MNLIRIFISYLFLCNSFALGLSEDELCFFNVGQGHAVLVNKVRTPPTINPPYVPLMIDAGATSRPFTSDESYMWEREEDDSLISKISARIMDFWKESNGGNLQGGNYKLNIIVTHADNDHSGLVPFVLKKLEEKRNTISFSFTPSLLLGGEQNHFEKSNARHPSFLSLLKEEYPRIYSSTCIGMHLQGNLGAFLEESGCITHLYCPKGIKSDQNRWSIVTRIQLNGISSILTGDANTKVKQDMLETLRLLGGELGLESDILLVPHHGAEGTNHNHWDEMVNPKAIVIGSAPNGGRLNNPEGYCHPRGNTLLNFLNLRQGRGRIWDKVKPHALQYHSEEITHGQIQETFSRRENHLFERIPNKVVDTQIQQPQARWHLVWSDIPIYTLWTTGTLVFSRDVRTPQFLEAPNGMMGYVAVSSPEYYLSPDQRPQNTELIYLIKLLLQDGEGNSDTVKTTVTAFPVEQIRGTEREGIMLTDNLSLYENRANILRTLLEIPQPERKQALAQLKSLTQIATKNFSARYRILSSLRRLEQGEEFLQYLREKSLLIPDDSLATAKALEVFSKIPFIQAQEIMGLFHPSIYQSFENISPRERENILKMIETLSALQREKRHSIFEMAKPFIMPYEKAQNPQLNFHDISNNASLIKLSVEIPPLELPLFQQQVAEAIRYLTADNQPGLYAENKHFFIRANLSVSARDRTNFLKGVLPIMKKVSDSRYESWEGAAIAEKIASIYTEPNYLLRLEYLQRQFSTMPTERTSEFISDTFKWWLELSKTYAEKKAVKNNNK